MKVKFTLALLLMGLSAAYAQDDCHSFWAVLSPDGNYIYFSSTMNGDHYEIYRTDIDGTSNLMRLTYMDVNCLYPSVSPDGTKIAFQYDNYGTTSEIYIMNSDGSELTRLTENSVHDGYPNFSPDGSTIVFEAWDDSAYPEVFTMNTDGSNRTQITNEPGANWQSAPQYNPDGSKIYFSQGYNADNYIVMMNPDGSNRVNVTEPNDFGDTDWALHFNADGTKISFFTTRYLGYNNGCDLILANPDGSGEEKLTNAGDMEYFYGAVFHPSNGKLYYSYLPGQGFKWAIYKMNMDATEQEKISECVPFGFEEVAVSEITISPNPVEDILSINHPTAVNMTIYDLTGKQLRSASGNSINVSELQQGLYFVIITTADNTLLQTQKFIKD